MAGPNTDGRGQIVKRSKSADAGGLLGLLKRMEPEIQRALPKHVTPDRMARVILTALRTTRDLEACTPASFLGCVMAASQLGLEPNTPLGHCYLIPRKNRRRNATECTLLIGYQGMLDLARRSGLVSSCRAHVVREGDVFSYEYGLDQRLVHQPKEDNHQAPVTHVYAIAKLKGGDPIFEVLTRREVEDRRARGGSSAGRSSPWDTDWEAMAMKTAIRALWRWLPKSSELASAIAHEESVERGLPTRWDPDVTRALADSGIEDAELVEPEALPADVDPETGEVSE